MPLLIKKGLRLLEELPEVRRRLAEAGAGQQEGADAARVTQEDPVVGDRVERISAPCPPESGRNTPASQGSFIPGFADEAGAAWEAAR